MGKRDAGPLHVALIVDTISQFDRNVILGIASYVKSHQHWSLYVEEDPLDKLPDLQAWHGDGIIANFDDVKVSKLVSTLKIPVVAFGGGYGWYKPESSIPYISKDNRGVARLAAEHLLERGFRHFAFCGLPGNRNNGWAKERAEAFQDFVTKAGFSCSVFSGRHSTSRKWTELQRSLVEWIKSLEKPVGLLACNDSRARHVLEACRTASARVPEDVAVVGVDNDELICELAQPSLTSIDQGARLIGFEAAQLLDKLMSGVKVSKKALKQTVPPMGIITRQSTETLAVDDPDVATALEMIRHTSFSKLKIQEVLDAVAVSRSTLEMRFKATLGRTIHEEMQYQRIVRARFLISSTEMPLKSIAHEVGCTTVQYFTSLFRQHTGLTPAEYRRNQRV